MKNLIFLTGEDLLDVDMPIVKEINAAYAHQFNITWIIVLRMYGWFSREELIKFCQANKIKHQILIQERKLKNPLNILFHLKLLNILKNYKPHIVYESYWGVPFMHFFRWLFLNKKRLVIAVHDVVEHYQMDNGFVRRFYYSFLIKTYQNFHIFSKTQLRSFKERFSGKNTFYSPLYLKDFGQAAAANVKEEGTVNFLFFGIIRPNKGLDLVIKAANLLSEKYSNFHIVVAGKCDDWQPYRDLVKDNARFTFKIRNIEKAEVPDLLSKAHFMLLPYRDVTQSGVLLSAYNYQVPVIASKLEWFEEYVDHNVNGYLFQSESVEELTAVMETAINLSVPDYREIIRQLEKAIYEKISVESIAKNYVDFFNTL